jgi:NAD-dependent DNA ligase
MDTHARILVLVMNEALQIYLLLCVQRPPPPRHGEKEIPNGSPTCLTGMQFVVTGVLESLDRDEAVQLCQRHGAKVVGAISGKVHILNTRSHTSARM